MRATLAGRAVCDEPPSSARTCGHTTSTPPVPGAMQAVAQVKGRERYEDFVEALGRRLATGNALANVTPREFGAGGPTIND